MILQLSPEDGRKADVGMSAERVRIRPRPSTLAPADEKIRLAGLERLQDLIDQALKGTLPLDRELTDWDITRFEPQHVQLVMARTTSKTIKEAADAVGMGPDQAGIVLAHPYAQLLLSTMLSMAADRIVDVTKRLSWLAPEALNVKVEIMRFSKNDSARSKAASDILEMAGYGGVKSSLTINQQNNVNSNNRVALSLGPTAAKGLLAALAESSQLPQIDYTKHLQAHVGDEVGAEHRQLSSSLPTGTGHTSSEGGASPSPSPSPSPFSALHGPEDVDFRVENWDGTPEDAVALAEALEDEAESKKEAKKIA